MGRGLLITIMILGMMVSSGVKAATIYNYWELDPSYVGMNIHAEVDLPGDSQIILGFLVEGFQGKPDERREHLDLAYFIVPTAIGEFTAGKFRPAWDYEVFDSIMLSGYAPGMVGLKYATSVYGLEYERFFTWMSGMRGKFFGHRLEIPVMPGVKIGLKETAIFAEEFDGFWINYVPLWPFYLTKYIPGVRTTYNNKNIGIDFKIELSEHLKLYGDLHVTEFPLGPDKRNLPIYGLFLGAYSDRLFVDGLSMEADYTRTMNYLYSHRNEETYYEYKGRTLGTPLGPDAERIGILFGYPVFPRISLFGGYRYERKGEGRIGDYYSNPDDVRDNLFLSGIVEKRHIPVVGLNLQVTPKLNVKVLAEMQFLTNKDHIEGVDGTRTLGTVALEWSF